MTPTTDQFEAYQNIFSYFKLPDIILNFSRKGKRVQGFFAPKRWGRGDNVVHEISVNPDASHAQDIKHVMATFVHEMAHLWQQEFGKVPRGGYHNKQWGDKMKEIGLYPSNTGEEGGKETGQQMTHYIIVGGGGMISLLKLCRKNTCCHLRHFYSLRIFRRPKQKPSIHALSARQIYGGRRVCR